MRDQNRLFGRRKRKFLPVSADRFHPGKIPLPRKGERSIIFLVAFVLNLVFSYLFMYVWQLGSLDALQSISKALYLLFNRASTLSALNLVQPPIPFILQSVPVFALKLVDASAFAAPLVSSFFGAGSLVLLNRILLLLRVHDRYRWILLLLTQFYPSLLFAIAIGSSETIHIFMILVVVLGTLLINRRKMAFLVCGFGITFGFFVRYRMIALIFGISLALMILKWKRHEQWQEELEGWLLAFATPPLYALGLWLLLNWLTQNDPLFFIKTMIEPSQGLSFSRNVGPTHPFFLGWDNFIETFAITAVNIWESSVLFVVSLALSLYFGFRSASRHIIATVIVVIVIPLTLAAMIFLGILPPWQYLWSSLIPLGIILACLGYQHLKPGLQNGLMVAIFILVFVSVWINIQSLMSSQSAPGEQRFHALLVGDHNREISLRNQDPYWVFQHDAPIVANALTRYSTQGSILIDGTLAAPILARSHNLQRMVILNHMTIEKIFSPDAAGADFALSLSMNESLNRSTLAYPAPDLSAEKIGWASRVWKSERTILDWGVYRLDLDETQGK